MTEAKQQHLPWIADRVPTMKDADYYGDVVTYRNNNGDESWVCTYWQDVDLGTPWLAFSPPQKEEKKQEILKSVSNILREPLDFDKFELKLQPKSLARKFVSIAANTLGSGDFYVLYAVADDGTAWRYEAWRHEDKWKQLPALPDRDA